MVKFPGFLFCFGLWMVAFSNYGLADYWINL